MLCHPRLAVIDPWSANPLENPHEFPDHSEYSRWVLIQIKQHYDLAFVTGKCALTAERMISHVNFCMPVAPEGEN
jgi:hypothetical protein